MLTVCGQRLFALGKQVVAKHGGKPPQLMVVILPENATDLYRAIKQYVNFVRGVLHLADPRHSHSASVMSLYVSLRHVLREFKCLTDYVYRWVSPHNA